MNALWLSRFQRARDFFCVAAFDFLCTHHRLEIAVTIAAADV
jgi:hypothetical protein